MSTFQSTVDYPAPCYLPNSSELDDVAAVLAKTKPVAHIPIDKSIVKNATFKALLKIAEDRKLNIETHENHLIIGDSKSSKDLKEAIELQTTNIDQVCERCSRIGKALGYSEDAISDFVEFGLRRGMTFYQRKFRRELCLK